MSSNELLWEDTPQIDNDADVSSYPPPSLEQTVIAEGETTEGYLTIVDKKAEKVCIVQDGKQIKKRRSAEELKTLQDAFVRLIKSGHPKLAIMAVLAIDSSEYDKLLGRAVERRLIGADDINSKYTAIKGAALGDDVLALLGVAKNVVLKVEKLDECGINVTAITREEVTF